MGKVLADRLRASKTLRQWGRQEKKDCLIAADGVFILVFCEAVHVSVAPVKLPLALASRPDAHAVGNLNLASRFSHSRPMLLGKFRHGADCSRAHHHRGVALLIVESGSRLAIALNP